MNDVKRSFLLDILSERERSNGNLREYYRLKNEAEKYRDNTIGNSKIKNI